MITLLKIYAELVYWENVKNRSVSDDVIMTKTWCLMYFSWTCPYIDVKNDRTSAGGRKALLASNWHRVENYANAMPSVKVRETYEPGLGLVLVEFRRSSVYRNR